MRKMKVRDTERVCIVSFNFVQSIKKSIFVQSKNLNLTTMKKLTFLISIIFFTNWAYNQCQPYYELYADDAQDPFVSVVVSTVDPIDSVFYNFVETSFWSNDSTAVYTYLNNGTYGICADAYMSSGSICTVCDTVTINGATGVPQCNPNFALTDVSNASNYQIDVNVMNHNPAHYYAIYWNGQNVVMNNYYETLTNNINIGWNNVCVEQIDSTQNPVCSEYVCDSVYVFYQNTGQCPTDFQLSLVPGGNGAVDVAINNYNPSAYYQIMTPYNYINGASANETVTYLANGLKYVCIEQIDSSFNPVCYSQKCDTISVNTVLNNCFSNGFLQLDSANVFTFIPTPYNSFFNYSWNFGDGNTSTSTFPTHTFGSAGTYNVCMTINDPTSNCADTTICQSYTVNPSAFSGMCNANFSWFIDSLQNNQLNLFNTSSGTITDYYWDFGDGNSSTQAYPVHNYPTNGPYYVCLTVSDSVSGCSSIYCDTIFDPVKSPGMNINVYPFSGSTGTANVEDLDLQKDVLEIYPNPGSDQVYVGLEFGEIKSLNIYDLQGRKTISESQSSEWGNTESLNKGVYIIFVTDQNGNNYTSRWVKN